MVNQPNRIKLLAMDVDGVLTDGGMYYSEQGEIFKKFNLKNSSLPESGYILFSAALHGTHPLAPSLQAKRGNCR